MTEVVLISSAIAVASFLVLVVALIARHYDLKARAEEEEQGTP